MRGVAGELEPPTAAGRQMSRVSVGPTMRRTLVNGTPPEFR